MSAAATINARDVFRSIKNTLDYTNARCDLVLEELISAAIGSIRYTWPVQVTGLEIVPGWIACCVSNNLMSRDACSLDFTETEKAIAELVRTEYGCLTVFSNCYELKIISSNGMVSLTSEHGVTEVLQGL